MLTELIESLYLSGADRPGVMDQLDLYLGDIEGNSLYAQIYCLLRTNGLLHKNPTFTSILQAGYEAVLSQNLYIRHEQGRILKSFDECQLEAIPFKGIALLERYYDNIGARGTSDIDLFIHRRDLNTAIQCLHNLGFSGPHRHNPIHFHCVLSKPVSSGSQPLNVELHWAFVVEGTSKMDTQSLWLASEVKQSYRHIRELSTQHTFYTLCLHGANHQMNSIKYSLDIAHMIYRFGDSIDFGLLLRQAKRDKTSRRVCAVLSMVYEQFPSLHYFRRLPIDARFPKKHTFSQPSSLFFLDSWLYRLREVKNRLIPPLDIASWHVKETNAMSSGTVYFTFYKMRFAKLRTRLVKKRWGANGRESET